MALFFLGPRIRDFLLHEVKRVGGFMMLYAVSALLLLCGAAVLLGRAQKGEFSGQVEVERVDVGQTALNHEVKRTIQSKPAEDAMRGAAAKDLAASEDLLHLATRNLHAIDGLLAVELILKIDRRGAGSPVRCAEKSALGQVTPSFR